MFDPTRDQSRLFWLDLWAKHQSRSPLTPLEAMATDILAGHPEYHGLMQDRERALATDYSPEAGITNPFLHMHLHLAVREQVSIDQPPGIRGLHLAMAQAAGDAVEAEHRITECLAEEIWQVQRHRTAFDGARYLACIRRQARAAGVDVTS